MCETQARVIRALATRLAELGDTETAGMKSRRRTRPTGRAPAGTNGRTDIREEDTCTSTRTPSSRRQACWGPWARWAAAIIAVYKVVEMNKKQTEFINSILEEQTLICYGLRGALQGLIEQGCNGPCKDALNRLDKHLNKSAHVHLQEE